MNLSKLKTFLLMLQILGISINCLVSFPPGTTWNLQYSGTLNLSRNVNAYDLDLFDTNKIVIDGLHRRSIKVICYFSAGSYEDWRPDASQFPKEVLGKNLDGWPGQKWLDIRAIAKLTSLMTNRILMAVQKGCDAVDPDNVDGYTQNSGFNISYNDQIKYNKWLAQLAHKNGIAIGLKNDLNQIKDLVGFFDFAINQQCFYYNQCNLLTPFITAGKAVFNVEYNLLITAFCPKAKLLKFSSIKKKLALNQYVEFCDVIK